MHVWCVGRTIPHLLFRLMAVTVSPPIPQLSVSTSSITTTAVAGAVTFVFLTVQLEVAATPAAFAAIALTFVFRALAILFNWRTAPVGDPAGR